jgi:hypothetical protein
MKTSSHLATTLLQMGQVSESCELRRHILDVRSRTLGPDHPATLNSLEHLANTLLSIDQLDEAKVMYENLLTKRIRLVGADHPDTQRTRDVLRTIGPDLLADP